MSMLLKLVQRLHRERLFIKHEQDTIWKLNEQVQHHAEQLSHLFWITRQHYLNLNMLIVNSAQGTPASCCRRSRSLDSVQFMDAYKEFGYQESMYSQFLEVFINNPTLAAACLAYGDKLGLEATSDIVEIVVLGCYGNSILSDDHKHLLELMESLVLLQLACEDQPRRVIQKGNCAFSIAFKLFTESLLSGKLFLTSALCQPVMEVLMDDELYLETCEQKILAQLNKFDIEQRFGQQDSPQMQEKLKLHVKKAEEKLSRICSLFIDSLLSAMDCFPKTLGWIMARAYFIVKDAGFVSHEEARALCSDFFLQQFVCPAIVNPELYGVTGDIPVGQLSRFNLMQIAQTLQVMAHSDDSVLKSEALFSSSDKEKMGKLIDSVIDVCNSSEGPPSHSTALGYIDSTVFFTSYQLSQLIKFLKDIQKSGVRGVDQSSLSTVLSHLPSQPPPCMERLANMLATHSSVCDEEGQERGGTITPIGGSAGDLASLSISQDSPTSKKKFLSKASKARKSARRSESMEYIVDGSASGDTGAAQQSNITEISETVLVISMSPLVDSSQDMPGTLSEHEVMELHTAQNISTSASNLAVESASIDARSLPETEGLEKRSRFSLYSGGSDLSEIDHELPTEDGISRTSGSSSIDIDNNETVPVDDASSYHVGNRDEDEEESGDLESVTHASNDEALKALRRKLPSSRESIEDKMRKFEIRHELGVRFADPGVTGEAHRDEGCQSSAPAPVDTRSDTWSMDAYASDSELQTEQQSDRLQDIAQDPAQHIRNAPSNTGSFLTLTRDDDSRSDVWSVEVLPSDSEPPDVRSEDRLRELDSEGASSTTFQSQYDSVEDNRSRASTPGLSVVSGFSAVSGLSLVSENHQVKVGGDEQWMDAERNKEAFKNSSDVNEPIKLNRYGGGGGLFERDKRHRYNANKNDQVIVDKALQQSSIKASATEVTRHDDLADIGKVSTSSEKNWQTIDASQCTVKVITDNKAGDTSSEDKLVILTDFTENVNTIKRSPNKRHQENRDDNDNIKRQPDMLMSWIENQDASISASKNNESDMIHKETMLLPQIRSQSSSNSPSTITSQVLQDFDPLLKSSGHELQSATPKTDDDDGEFIPRKDGKTTEDGNHSPASAADMSYPADSAFTSEERHKSLKPTSRNSNESQSMQPEKRMTSISPELMESGQRKGVDRKKSWWKNNRLSTFAKKKVSSKGSVLGSFDNNGAFESNRHPNRITPPHTVDDSLSTSNTGTLIEGLSTSEAIMQKYMKKVSVNHKAMNDSKDDNPLPLNHLDGSASVSVDPNLINVSTANAPTNSPSFSLLDDASATQPVVSSAPSATSWDHTASSAVTTSCPLNAYDSSEKSEPDLKEEAKRKLRIVLSMTKPVPEPSSPAVLFLDAAPNDLQMDDDSTQSSGSKQMKLRDQLLSFLRTEHARALLLQNYSHISQLHEATRCVEALDDDNCKLVVKSLWTDYKMRSTYVAYLVQARQHLLATVSYLQHIVERTNRDKSICRQYFTAQCVKLFMQDKENALARFCKVLVRSITLDEKVQLIKDFLSSLYGQMVESPIWEGASQDQIEDGERRIERYIFSFVYKQAMFPNGDGDILRDHVESKIHDSLRIIGRAIFFDMYLRLELAGWPFAWSSGESTHKMLGRMSVVAVCVCNNNKVGSTLYHQHIVRLATVITPAHSSLLVRKKYLLECPWPSAQREARALAAYRSPRGKLEAALRCCRAIMHLLKLADENQAPGADDFTPVLVFVLIKANPPHLLSTVQYVNSFVGDALTGEDSYWWMQFTAATEFIKTIDERK